MQHAGDGGGIYIRGAQGTSYADGLLLSGNVVTGARLEQEAIFNAGIYTDDTTNWITVRGNVIYDYLASIGGCDEQGAPVDQVRFEGNFWDGAVPAWVDRLHIPGGWPCGAPHHVSFQKNTALPASDPERVCQAETACAAILADAGRRCSRISNRRFLAGRGV
jgi:hypothetical protein